MRDRSDGKGYPTPPPPTPGGGDGFDAGSPFDSLLESRSDLARRSVWGSRYGPVALPHEIDPLFSAEWPDRFDSGQPSDPPVTNPDKGGSDLLSRDSALVAPSNVEPPAPTWRTLEGSRPPGRDGKELAAPPPRRLWGPRPPPKRRTFARAASSSEERRFEPETDTHHRRLP